MLSTVEKDDVYMVNYSDAYFDLYVLMTTANFPDIMCVAFRQSGMFDSLASRLLVATLISRHGPTTTFLGCPHLAKTSGTASSL